MTTTISELSDLWHGRHAECPLCHLDVSLGSWYGHMALIHPREDWPDKPSPAAPPQEGQNG